MFQTKMRRIALILIALSLPAFVSAKDTRSVEKFQFKGKNALAYFASNENPCVFTDAYVDIGTIRYSAQPASQNGDVQAVISVSKYNLCTDTLLLYAFGAVQLSGSNFQIAESLKSAFLKTTVDLFDYVNGGSFVVNVHINWVGTREVYRGNDHSNVHSPYGTFHSHSIGVFREAAAAGTISDGSTNLIPEPSGYAQISSVKSGYMEIDK